MVSKKIQQTNSDDGSRSQGHALFPWKLHDMLKECEMEGKDAVVSWQPHGRAFKVHNSRAFVADIMPLHFKQTKYKSFQRQLNLWGFKRIIGNRPDKGAYYHPRFMRDHQDFCRLLTRQSTKKGSPASDDEQENDPNFEAMELILSKMAQKKESSVDDSSSFKVIAPHTTHFQKSTISSLNQYLFEKIEFTKAPQMPENPVDFEGCQFFLIDEAEDEWLSTQPTKSYFCGHQQLCSV
jgi:hypothetical protein